MGLFGKSGKSNDERLKELYRKREEHKENSKAKGGWTGFIETLANDIQEQQQKFEEENFPERIRWQETLQELINDSSMLDDLSDDQLVDYKIMAQSELGRLEGARGTLQTGELRKGQIFPSELPILPTLIERNTNLIAFINARQENRKHKPALLPDKTEQRNKREEGLYEKLESLKSKRERLIKMETGGKPFEEWTEEEHRKVKIWENSIEAQEERIREELTNIWESL
jgi:hypothetical protein